MNKPEPRLLPEESRRYEIAVDCAIEAYVAGGQKSLLLRLAFQFITWIILARAIVLFDLNWLLILLPLILEFQLLLWLGPPMAALFVKDSVFRKHSGSWSQALIWSFVLLLPVMILLLIEFEFKLEPLRQFISTSWQNLLVNGVGIACAAVTVSLIIDSVRDVRRWKKTGGAFVWPATLRIGLRLISLFMVAVLLGFAIAGVSTLYDLFGKRMDWFDYVSSTAWAALLVIVLSDLFEYLLSYLLYRKKNQQQARR